MSRASFAKAPALAIDEILGNRDLHIIVCTGAGGVGKTTTAAALALRAAEQGRDVCVLTIDPAKRLAQAMGLTALDNTPRQVLGVSGELAERAATLQTQMRDILGTLRAS